jgi:catechol 2,3-dioxygenase-like lactoylglutathione lyase family enzyme
MKKALLHHAHITIPPEAEKETVRFYCDLLGFEEVSKPPELTYQSHWLRMDNCDIHVGVEDSPVDRQSTQAHLAYLVPTAEQLEQMRGRLETTGIATEDAQPWPGRKRFLVRDPGGNLVEVGALISEDAK